MQQLAAAWGLFFHLPKVSQLAIHVGHRSSVGNLCDFLLCTVDNLHYLEQGFWHSILFIIEHNCYDKSFQVRQICYMVFSLVKKLAILFALCFHKNVNNFLQFVTLQELAIRDMCIKKIAQLQLQMFVQKGKLCVMKQKAQGGIEPQSFWIPPIVAQIKSSQAINIRTLHAIPCQFKKTPRIQQCAYQRHIM